MPIRSSTSPSRPSGMRASERARVCWPSSSSPYIHAVSLERKTVGAIALTVMPCLAHSVAEHAGQRVGGALRGAIAGIARDVAVAAAHRRHHQHLAADLLVDPIAADGLGHEPDAAHIGIHHGLPVLVLQLVDEARLVHARRRRRADRRGRTCRARRPPSPWRLRACRDGAPWSTSPPSSFTSAATSSSSPLVPEASTSLPPSEASVMRAAAAERARGAGDDARPCRSRRTARADGAAVRRSSQSSSSQVSSPRMRGPRTTDLQKFMRIASSRTHVVWVPAFAGTTAVDTAVRDHSPSRTGSSASDRAPPPRAARSLRLPASARGTRRRCSACR